MLYGDNRRGDFPSNVKAAVQYDENLQALAIALNTAGAVSIKCTHVINGVRYENNTHSGSAFCKEYLSSCPDNVNPETTIADGNYNGAENPK